MSNCACQTNCRTQPSNQACLQHVASEITHNCRQHVASWPEGKCCCRRSANFVCAAQATNEDKAEATVAAEAVDEQR